MKSNGELPCIFFGKIFFIDLYLGIQRKNKMSSSQVPSFYLQKKWDSPSKITKNKVCPRLLRASRSNILLGNYLTNHINSVLNPWARFIISSPWPQLGQVSKIHVQHMRSHGEGIEVILFLENDMNHVILNPTSQSSSIFCKQKNF